jgi:hypothetical protein
MSRNGCRGALPTTVTFSASLRATIIRLHPSLAPICWKPPNAPNSRSRVNAVSFRAAAFVKGSPLYETRLQFMHMSASGRDVPADLLARMAEELACMTD